MMAEWRVSIPFKREGTWKRRHMDLADGSHERVSIPFKREGTWKRDTNHQTGNKRS